MPGVDTECKGIGATHHYACKCREEYFKNMEVALTKAMEALQGIIDWAFVEPICGQDTTSYKEKAREALREIDEVLG